MHKAWKIIKTVFWVAVIVGSLFVIFSSLDLFGYRMYVVKSGSMEPKIHTGSVVIDHKANNYNLKDVITFKVQNSKDTVTHRIYKINADKSFTVKGDANKTADPDPVQKTNVVGKVLFSIPFLGYFIAFLRTLPGLIIFIIAPAVIIISDEIANIKSEAARIVNARKKVVKEVEKIEEFVEEEEKKIFKKRPKRPKIQG
jgi:signal peptidase